jgi:hypothetical protein
VSAYDPSATPDPTVRPPSLPWIDTTLLDAMAASAWQHLTRTERAAAHHLAGELRDAVRRLEIALAAGQRGAL